MTVKIEGGETIHIKATAIRQCGGDVFVQVDFHPYSFQGWIMGDLIVHAEPKPPEPLKVGDLVRFVTGSMKYAFGGQKIIALAGNDAWIEWPQGDHDTHPLIGLERVEPGEVGPGETVK